MATGQVTDEALARALGVYSGLVHVVVSDPERWLPGEPPVASPSSGLARRTLGAVSRRALGEASPSSVEWNEQPIELRIRWWVSRIGTVAGLAAATPRLAGVMSDRLPVQATLGASAAGLAVCAVAWEHGLAEPHDWVPLLASVIFKRNLSNVTFAVPNPGIAEQDLNMVDALESDGAAAIAPSHDGGIRRSAQTLWRLARTLRSVDQLLQDRPRGGRMVRSLGKLPVVGLPVGWLDERAGIEKAAAEAGRVLSGTPARNER